MLAVIRAHASPHAFVEIADNCWHPAWYARGCEDLPQQLSVDRVARFLQIDVQGDFPLSSELLQPAHDEKHIDR